MGRLPRRLQSSVIVWRARIPRVPRSRGCRCCVCLHQRLRKQCTSFPPSETGIPFRILFLFLCFEDLSAGLVCCFVTCALAPEDLSHDLGPSLTSGPLAYRSSAVVAVVESVVLLVPRSKPVGSYVARKTVRGCFFTGSISRVRPLGFPAQHVPGPGRCADLRLPGLLFRFRK